MSSLGTLSIHLDGARCRVGCDFCYLGARKDQVGRLDSALLEAALGRLDYHEIAVALSDPIEPAAPHLDRIFALARAPVSITTTCAIAAHHPRLLHRAARISLSIDPYKAPTAPARIASLCEKLRENSAAEIVLLVSLVSPQFCEQLFDGLLDQLLELPTVDKVALNALKPPPPWCDRIFWLQALNQIEPLLKRHLERRLFLDCYVAARFLKIGDCPARADLSPTANGLAFRSCVYQPTADFEFSRAEDAVARLQNFQVPAACPFPV